MCAYDSRKPRLVTLLYKMGVLRKRNHGHTESTAPVMSILCATLLLAATETVAVLHRLAFSAASSRLDRLS